MHASLNFKQSVSLETTDEDLNTNNFKDLLAKTYTYSDLLAVREQNEDGGSDESKTEHEITNMKDLKTINFKDSPAQLQEEESRALSLSTEVPETTLMHASVTYKQLVSLKTTDEDLKTNDFKDSLAKTYTYSDLLAVSDRNGDGGSGGSETEYTNVNAAKKAAAASEKASAEEAAAEEASAEMDAATKVAAEDASSSAKASAEAAVAKAAAEKPDAETAATSEKAAAEKAAAEKAAAEKAAVKKAATEEASSSAKAYAEAAAKAKNEAAEAAAIKNAKEELKEQLRVEAVNAEIEATHKAKRDEANEKFKTLPAVFRAEEQISLRLAEERPGA